MISTTIEQSKHLIERGVPIESADMYYLIIAEDEYSRYPQAGDKETILRELPCWSLSALFSLLPIECKLEKILLDQSDYFTYSCVWTDEYRTYEYENPIDAVYEMLCYVKENYK